MRSLLMTLSTILLGIAAVTSPVWAQPATMAPAPVVGAEAYHLHHPLMIIRFNQPRVYFKRSLYKAVSRAVEAKPSVIFDVVSWVPEATARDTRRQALYTKRTQQNVQRVINEMVKLGVPRNRFRVSWEKDPYVRAQEVHIYVR